VIKFNHSAIIMTLTLLSLSTVVICTNPKTEEAMNTKDNILAKIKQYNTIEPQYPSYVDQNHYGICLRASDNLKKGTVVATCDLEVTDKEYIADHPSEEHKYVALMDVSKDGKPTYGNVRGKWAFCNHSCDPNCDTSDTWEIITNREIQKGEELTTSYDSFVDNFPWPDTWNFVCLCAALNCKKIIKEYRMDIIYPIKNK